MWHDVIHWLDDLRGAFGLQTFSWNSVRGNIGAIPWQFALLTPLSALLWPRLRHAIERFFKTRFDALHAKLDAHHAEAMSHHANALESHRAAIIDELKAHIDKRLGVEGEEK